MSKQEILSWTSFITSLSAIIFYVILVLGWPNFLPDYSSDFFQLFFKLFWIAVGIEIVVEILWKRQKVDRDERDFKIEALGYKYAFHFLIVVIVLLLVQMGLSLFFESMNAKMALITETITVFHILILALFTTSLIRRVVMIYNYRKGWG
ncbi:MAG: hypothetical protein GVY02_01510 [Bacteroidetes bacterium]|jgi:sensor histidine kinase YesM|nr:hypothetical protein [Bacteroidota bacterium]